MPSLSKRCDPTMRVFTLSFLFTIAAMTSQMKPPGGSPQDVLTYHGDNLRTG
jgi:hypothetical protein